MCTENPSGVSRAAGHELATLLDTGLDRTSVELVMKLCELGVNPEALAAVIKELRAEADRVKAEAAGAK